jgi:CrcB protein
MTTTGGVVADVGAIRDSLRKREVAMQQLVTVCLIGIAGALGAVARYGTTAAMKYFLGDGFPAGTLVVNVLGCFFLGFLAQLGEQQLSGQVKLMLSAGFLGALTTFSTFGVETVNKFYEGQLFIAFLNIGLNLFLGLAAVYGGMAMFRSFQNIAS